MRRERSSERPRGFKLGSGDPSPPLERREREPVRSVAPECLPATTRAPTPPVALVQDPVSLSVEKLFASLHQLFEVCPRDLHGDPPAHHLPLPFEPGLYSLAVEGHSAVGSLMKPQQAARGCVVDLQLWGGHLKTARLPVRAARGRRSPRSLARRVPWQGASGSHASTW